MLLRAGSLFLKETEGRLADVCLTGCSFPVVCLTEGLLSGTCLNLALDVFTLGLALPLDESALAGIDSKEVTLAEDWFVGLLDAVSDVA